MIIQTECNNLQLNLWNYLMNNEDLIDAVNIKFTRSSIME